MTGSLKEDIAKALNSLYGIDMKADDVLIDHTREDFEGDFTLVVFPYLKQSKKSPEQTARDIGDWLQVNSGMLGSYNVIKGFLNLTVRPAEWISFLRHEFNNPNYGFKREAAKDTVLVEYSSPNTNKPLHLGHIRNNLLGYSVAQILKANGNAVFTCNLVNDRGIHICKSMIAWMKYGNGETPETSGMKGDHLVGKYYVEFDRHYKQEVADLVAAGTSKEDAEKQAPLMQEANELLRKWEADDASALDTWKTMNGWVYAGFEETYKKLGVSFDKTYYESDTYLLGKEIVQEGLDKGVFFKKPDGSVWVDLTADGLDQKLLLRADGTSVYMTQDLGTAELKYTDFHCNRSIYVVGNEQEYHFKVLQLICKKLGRPYATGIYHLSYGMVELPHGKMKSREGTVVDADDLIAEMETTAEETTKALGKTEGLAQDELPSLYHMIAMGALKYFLLKVDPKKKMLFNPQESIDFHGNTGPFIQYTHARIRSVLRNADAAGVKLDAGTFDPSAAQLNTFEKAVISWAWRFAETVEEAGAEMSPGVVCNYVFELARAYNQFYHECPILKEPDANQRTLRLMLCSITANIIRSAFGLLGIGVPERM
jgi:arginyl-tRNA synthetase